MKSDRPFLAHIADSIAAVETYVAGGREVFLRERMDVRLVWDVIEHELPALKAAVGRLLAGPSDV